MEEGVGEERKSVSRKKGIKRDKRKKEMRRTEGMK
jgi:hypothetical protein